MNEREVTAFARRFDRIVEKKQRQAVLEAQARRATAATVDTHNTTAQQDAAKIRKELVATLPGTEASNQRLVRQLEREATAEARERVLNDAKQKLIENEETRLRGIQAARENYEARRAEIAKGE